MPNHVPMSDKTMKSNAPSIPSHNNVYGYEENNNGELVRQKNAIKTYKGVGVDRVGPGDYDPNSFSKSAGPLTEWKKPIP
jgi:hypothetical protein